MPTERLCQFSKFLGESWVADFWGQLHADPAVSELGGAHNNEGVDYSRYLAMSLIVERELEGATDYAVVFEYLQDIALLDSASDPKSALLVQVKKKTPGIWSKSDLCRQQKSKGSSTSTTAPKAKAAKGLDAKSALGKLYLCVHKLGARIPTTGMFLSNAGYDVLKDGKRIPDYARILIANLDASESDHIRDKLHAELKLGHQPNLQLLTLRQTNIIPAAMRETVRGILAEFLETQYPDIPDVSGRLLESLLKDFAARSGVKGQVDGIGDLIQLKGYTRGQFNLTIQGMAGVTSGVERLRISIEGLKADGMPARQADRLSTQADKVRIQLVRDPQSRDAFLWQSAVDAAQQNQNSDSYLEMLNNVTQMLESTAAGKDIQFTNDGGARAVALLAIVYVDQQSSPAGPVAANQVQ